MSTMEQTAVGNRVGRARLAPSQLWQLPTFVIGLLVFLAVAASAPVRHPIEWWQFDSALTELRQFLQEKDHDPSELVSRAESLLQQVHRFGDRAGETHFLAGSAYYRQALAQSPALVRDIWPRAVEHLEEAIQLGTDERDQAALQYRLGRSLFAQGRDVPRALELMSRSVDKGAEQPLAGYQLLLDAYLKLPTPDLDAAIDASSKIIELTDEREPDAPARLRLAHIELLLRKDRRAEAIKELDRVGAKVSRPLQVKARLVQVRLCEQDGQWAKALSVWRELMPDADQVPGGKARVQYAIGWCSLHVETPDCKQAVAAWQDALKLGGEEGQAAGLRLGALRLFSPNADPARGLEAWRQALAELEGPADYRNAYLELTEARALFEQAIAMFHDRNDYEKMQIAAELYRKLAPDGVADEKLAQAAEAQARKLHDAADGPSDAATAQFLRAADAYAVTAAGRTGKQQFDALWRAANCYLQAHAADRATPVLIQLNGLDQEDARLGEGWFLLGETHRAAATVGLARWLLVAETRRAAGQAALARSAYLRSMQYANTAARARYQLALAASDEQKWDEAEEILKPILTRSAADRDTHENALYLMAWAQLQKQDLDRALYFLNDAAGQYPGNPLALVVRSQLAECYRRLAQRAFEQEKRAREAFDGATEERKYQIQELVSQTQQARRKWLNEARGAYFALIDKLRVTERQRPLTEVEGILARRSFLGVAECHHDLGEYLEALRLYQELVQRYRGKVETLLACERVVQLQKLVVEVDVLSTDGKREVEAVARSLLPLAQADLGKMDPDAPDFQGTGVWSRALWQEWFVAEEKRLAPRAVLP